MGRREKNICLFIVYIDTGGRGTSTFREKNEIFITLSLLALGILYLSDRVICMYLNLFIQHNRCYLYRSDDIYLKYSKGLTGI